MDTHNSPHRKSPRAERAQKRRSSIPPQRQPNFDADESPKKKPKKHGFYTKVKTRRSSFFLL